MSVDYAWLSDRGYDSFCPRKSKELVDISLGKIAGLLYLLPNLDSAQLQSSWVWLAV